jgi:chromosome segregation ATPase
MYSSPTRKNATGASSPKKSKRPETAKSPTKNSSIAVSISQKAYSQIKIIEELNG